MEHTTHTQTHKFHCHIRKKIYVLKNALNKFQAQKYINSQKYLIVSSLDCASHQDPPCPWKIKEDKLWRNPLGHCFHRKFCGEYRSMHYVSTKPYKITAIGNSFKTWIKWIKQKSAINLYDNYGKLWIFLLKIIFKSEKETSKKVF